MDPHVTLIRSSVTLSASFCSSWDGVQLHRSAPAGWSRAQTEWDEEAIAPAQSTEGSDSQAEPSEADSSVGDVEADKIALTALAMHLPVRALDVRSSVSYGLCDPCDDINTFALGEAALATIDCTVSDALLQLSVLKCEDIIHLLCRVVGLLPAGQCLDPAQSRMKVAPAPQVPPMIIEPALWVVQPSGVMAKVPLTLLESRGSAEVRLEVCADIGLSALSPQQY